MIRTQAHRNLRNDLVLPALREASKVQGLLVQIREAMCSNLIT